MSWFKAKDLLDRTFEVGIILKGLDGVVELVGGVLLLAVSPATIDRMLRGLTRRELSGDPHDLIASDLLRISHSLTSSAVRFAAVYLLLHGIVKVVLVAALLRNKMWAYPWMIAVLLAFVGYQLYRIAVQPALWLVLLTIFDAFVAWLTWREYRKQRAARIAAA